MTLNLALPAIEARCCRQARRAFRKHPSCYPLSPKGVPSRRAMLAFDALIGQIYQAETSKRKNERISEEGLRTYYLWVITEFTRWADEEGTVIMNRIKPETVLLVNAGSVAIARLTAQKWLSNRYKAKKVTLLTYESLGKRNVYKIQYALSNK